jgi:IS30 family transposase
MSLKKNPYTTAQRNRSAPKKVKEWAIKKLKEGSSPNKIAQDIQKLFGVYVALMTIYRWKKKYIEVTGENILGWHHLNKTLEQKIKNKSKKEKK